MNIKTLINSIIDLDNENKALKNKLSKYETPIHFGKAEAVNTDLDESKKAIFLIGLEHSCNCYSSPFSYEENVFNKDTRKFITFEAWIQGVTIDEYYRKYFPKVIQDNLSNKQIIELYNPYLKQKYEKLVEEAKVELMNEAKESSED